MAVIIFSTYNHLFSLIFKNFIFIYQKIIFLLFKFRYETGNQITAQEQGSIKNQGTDAEALSVQGSYSYIDLDGNQITVNYIADGKNH